MSDARDLHLEIDFRNEKHGWIDSYLTFDNKTYVLWTTAVYPPFRGLLNFLRAVATNRLPAWFYWDMEGHGAYFEAWLITEGSPDFHLRIHSDREHLLMVDADLGREAVVDVLLAAVREVALYWNEESLEVWELDLKDIVKFEEFLNRIVPITAPRTDISRALPVRFVLSGENDDETHWLEIELLERRFLQWQMEDTDPCWPGLFDFVEQVLRGCQAELTYYDLWIERMREENPAYAYEYTPPTEREWPYRLFAVPLEHPRNFRLQIYANHWNFFQQNLLIFDEVLDRVQFAEAFLEMFETRLADGYEPISDHAGVVFDLRTLPVALLRELIQQINT